MGPAILARADVAPFAAKIHGSALEYTVKPHPRFLPYAYEGMEAAAGRPGRLRPHRRIPLGGAPRPPKSERQDPPWDPPASTSKPFSREARGRPVAARCGPWAGRADSPSTYTSRAGLPGLPVRNAPSRDRLVVFVGKLIVSKGVDLLLAAWPLVHAKHPGPASRSRATAPTRTASAASRRRSIAATSTTPAPSPPPDGASKGERRSRCRSSPPSSPTRPPATPRRPAPRPARSSGSAGSSTTRSPRSCRRPRRW